MELSSSFSKNPGQDPHSYFRNICIEFRKVINSSKNIDELQQIMNDFINASRQMIWKREKHQTYKKDEYEKAADKVFSEFTRYIEDLEQNPKSVISQDLLDALNEIERLIKSNKVI